MLPTVTIVILNYNGRDLLPHCLESIFALDYPQDQLEVILVDNGSSDGSAHYVALNFPTVRVIGLPTNVGFAKGNNLGARAARSEYVAFLNNDMRVDQRWLLELVQTIQKSDDVAAVGSKILSWDGSEIDFIGGTLNFYGMGFQPTDQSQHGDDCVREVLFACGGALLARRSVFLESGGFDEDFFAYFEDVDWGWRLWILGYRVLLQPKAIAYHRGHATGKKFAAEQRAVLYERNALYMIIKNYEESTLERILPVALLLTAKRSSLLSGCDKRTFRMGNEVQPHSIWPASRGPALLIRSSLRREFKQLLEEFGVWAVLKEAIRRILRWFYARTVLQIRRDVAVIPRVALSPLMALDDLAEALPDVWRRREEIQRRRVRSDAEILPLFGDPFHPHPPDPLYFDLQQRLVSLFHINDFFKNSGHG